VRCSTSLVALVVKRLFSLDKPRQWGRDDQPNNARLVRSVIELLEYQTVEFPE
jgi:hypothetical protein